VNKHSEQDNQRCKIRGVLHIFIGSVRDIVIRSMGLVLISVSGIFSTVWYPWILTYDPRSLLFIYLYIYLFILDRKPNPRKQQNSPLSSMFD